MKKEVTAEFTLSDSEVREALYDFYVRKFKGCNINAIFNENMIDISEIPLVRLRITEEREYEK